MKEIKFRAWDGKRMHHNVSWIPGWGFVEVIGNIYENKDLL